MLKRIIEELQFISTIPKGGKPNFYDKTIISNTEWFMTIRRRIKGEKGERGVIYMQNFIENIEKIYKTLDVKSLKILKEKLIEANIGINNIVYTYKIEEQNEVSKDYLKCLKRIDKLISIIEADIKKKNNFFGHCPTIIRE